MTLSREGKKYCDYASKETGVPTEILLCDYRQTPLGQKFDKIASIEMAEHVGLLPRPPRLALDCRSRWRLGF